MEGTSGPVAFVFGSKARRDVLVRLSEQPSTGRELVESTTASESAVYNALNRLADRGLVSETGHSWQLSGSGRLIADVLDQCDRLDRVLEADTEYWRTHDASVLPRRHRETIHRIDDVEVVRTPETDPYRTVRRIQRAIEDADEISIITPVYNDRHAEALLAVDAHPRRLIMTPDMVEQVLRDDPSGPDEDDRIDEVEIRVAPSSIALTLTDSELHCSLPRSDGSYDTRSELLATCDEALEWGQSLFEDYWKDARDVDEWIAAELPEFAPR